MLRFGAIVRFLMLAVCLVPFTSAQQAAGALAPLVPVVPAPVGDAPAPVGEEDEERETEDGKGGREGHAAQHQHRAPVRELIDRLPPAHAFGSHLTSTRTTPPVTADPFRNGLGTPYRC